MKYYTNTFDGSAIESTTSALKKNFLKHNIYPLPADYPMNPLPFLFLHFNPETGDVSHYEMRLENPSWFKRIHKFLFSGGRGRE